MLDAQRMQAAQAMDVEATKLTMAFSSNPVSLDECYPLSERFLGTAFVLTDLWWVYEHHSPHSEHQHMHRIQP